MQGAIPLPSGGWPTKRPLGGAANVPAELLYKLSLHSFFVCFHGGSCYFPKTLSLAARARRRRKTLSLAARARRRRTTADEKPQC